MLWGMGGSRESRGERKVTCIDPFKILIAKSGESKASLTNLYEKARTNEKTTDVLRNVLTKESGSACQKTFA